MNGFGTGYFANMVFDKSDWRIDGQNVHDALAAADNATAQALDAADPDLNAFNGAGGKLIQYHGWNDAAFRRKVRSTTTSQSRPSSASQAASAHSTGCFWHPGWIIVAAALAQMRSAAFLASPRPVTTPLMMLSRLSPIGLKTVWHRAKSSRRAIATMTQPKASRRSGRGAPIRRPRASQDRATVAQPPALFVRSGPSEAAGFNVHAPR